MKKLYEELYARQMHYAEAFLLTSEFLEKQGLYKKIVDFLHGGDLIIDVGCGDCRLIHRLKEKNSDTTIIGIDTNSTLLMIGNDIVNKSINNINTY